MKEADLIMGPFADVMIERLSDTDLDDYEQLMQVPDSDLYRWVVSGETPPRPYNTPVFRRLREFHQPGGEPV
jgi:antitoxin CptB